MPRYDYECSGCGDGWEATHSIIERKSECCSECGVPAEIVHLTTPAFHVVTPYFDKQLGVPITSKRHRDAVAKSMDLVDTGDYKHTDDIPLGKPEIKHDEKKWDEVWKEVMVDGQI